MLIGYDAIRQSTYELSVAPRGYIAISYRFRKHFINTRDCP